MKDSNCTEINEVSDESIDSRSDSCSVEVLETVETQASINTCGSYNL